MPRYFIDTCCLIGLTFFHDRWYRDVKPLYENNRLYASEAVLYEYCNRGEDDPYIPDNPGVVDITTDAAEGKYDAIRTELIEELPHFQRQVDRLQQEGLDLSTVVDAFIDHFSIREQAESQIREYFADYFAERALIARQVKRCARELVDRILYTSEQNKKTLLREVVIVESRYHEMEDTRETIEYETDQWIREPDFCLLLDAVRLAEDGVLSRLVTGDAGYLHAEAVTAERYGLALVWAGNEFYTDDLGYDPVGDNRELLDQTKEPDSGVG